MLIAHLNSALNPLLYGIFNPLFQKGYKNVLFFIIRRKIKNNINQQNTCNTTVKIKNDEENKQVVSFETKKIFHVQIEETVL